MHSLAATDVCSGWTEAAALLAREQNLVVEGFLPSFELRERAWDAAKSEKSYRAPATPSRQNTHD